MNIMKTNRVALMALARNKMRSFLTALGIIIGVGAVIAMVSIGQGAKADVEKRFEDMGVTDFNAAIMNTEDGAYDRTLEFIASIKG